FTRRSPSMVTAAVAPAARAKPVAEAWPISRSVRRSTRFVNFHDIVPGFDRVMERCVAWTASLKPPSMTAFHVPGAAFGLTNSDVHPEWSPLGRNVSEQVGAQVRREFEVKPTLRSAAPALASGRTEVDPEKREPGLSRPF